MDEMEVPRTDGKVERVLGGCDVWKFCCISRVLCDEWPRDVLSGLSSQGSSMSPLRVTPIWPPWRDLNSSRYSLTALACERITLWPTLMTFEHGKLREEALNLHPRLGRGVAFCGAEAIA